ncbi:hypothetical protein U1Q18_042895 [Sarracenia purpurea var. burkii]
MMTNSHNGATSKCFSGVFRRLLCTDNLPTHPSDHLAAEPNSGTSFSRRELKKEVMKKTAQAPATPGVVAKLMGLDSLPADLNWVPKQRTFDSFLRSRSVNSVDFLPEFDLITQQSLHRRVMTSVSFQEVGSFSQPQSHDFFVLCFERRVGGGSQTMSLRDGKSEMGLRESKQKEADRERNREGCRERKFEKKRENPQNNKNCKRINVVHRHQRESTKAKTSMETGNKKKSSKCAGRKRVQPICNSENSRSPVSVLDVQTPYSTRPENTSSSGDSRDRSSNPRKKSSRNVANHENPSPNSGKVFTADDHARRAKRNRDEKAVKISKEKISQYYAELVSQICRLAEEDIQETNWKSSKRAVFNSGFVGEICTEFGQQILDLLLHQLIDELLTCSIKSTAP